MNRKPLRSLLLCLAIAVSSHTPLPAAAVLPPGAIPPPRTTPSPITLPRPNKPLSDSLSVRDTITRGNYTLFLINNAPNFSPGTLRKMIDAFFTVYPKEARRFNPKTLKKVTFFIDPAYDASHLTNLLGRNLFLSRKNVWSYKSMLVA